MDIDKRRSMAVIGCEHNKQNSSLIARNEPCLYFDRFGVCPFVSAHHQSIIADGMFRLVYDSYP